MYTQPQVSLHPFLLNNAKYFATFMGSYVSSTLLQLSLVCNMTDQSSFTTDFGTENFLDAEAFAKAYEAFDAGKGVQADWSVAAKTNGYVAFTLQGISYAYPAFTNVPASTMSTRSGKILLGIHESSWPAGWLQYGKVLDASRSAALVQHGANLILGDFLAPVALKTVAQRALDFAAKVREVPGYGQSLEGLVVGRAGLTLV